MDQTPRVLAIALRTAMAGPMQLVEEADGAVDAGLSGDLPVKPDRGVTLLSNEQWQETLADLKVDLPWHTRRANVLIEGVRMGDLLGKTVRLGAMRLEVTGETEPCALMDFLHDGLMHALKDDCRAGVLCRVLNGGMIRVGDTLVVEDETEVETSETGGEAP
jgi:MOSC domain-containing protein YiiM